MAVAIATNEFFFSLLLGCRAIVISPHKPSIAPLAFLLSFFANEGGKEASSLAKIYLKERPNSHNRYFFPTSLSLSLFSLLHLGCQKFLLFPSLLLRKEKEKTVSSKMSSIRIFFFLLLAHKRRQIKGRQNMIAHICLSSGGFQRWDSSGWCYCFEETISFDWIAALSLDIRCHISTNERLRFFFHSVWVQ